MTAAALLDTTDWKILRELQADGRMTNVELAARVGLSPPPCLRRVQALEKAGIIASYRAVLDAAKLGFGVVVFAQVGLKSQAEAELRSFEARVAAWPLVREAYAVSGEADFILKIVAENLASLQEFVIGSITGADNVESVKTTFALRNVKYQPGLPLS